MTTLFSSAMAASVAMAVSMSRQDSGESLSGCLRHIFSGSRVPVQMLSMFALSVLA